MFAEQVLYKGLESAEYAVAFPGVLDGHDSLTDYVTRTQVECAAGLVAEVNERLAGEFASLDGSAVEPIFVEPLVIILCL